MTERDRGFIRLVHELCQEGLPQAEIATRAGLRDAPDLHYRVRRLGFRLVASTRSRLEPFGGWSLEMVLADDPQEVTA